MRCTNVKYNLVLIMILCTVAIEFSYKKTSIKPPYIKIITINKITIHKTFEEQIRTENSDAGLKLSHIECSLFQKE